MKVNFKYAMLAVAALTLGLTSCSNDNDDVTTGSGQEAKVNISVTSPAGSRAVATDPATVPTDKVNNFSVFIVDGDKLYKGYSSDGNSLSGTNAISATTTASSIYVIANAGDLTSEITSVAGLTSYVADLNTQTGANGRWATGNVALAANDFSQSGDKYEATKSVTLTFIAARITVKVVNNMTNYGQAGSVKVNDIAIINARGESLLFGTSLIPSTYTAGKKYYQGVANDNFSFYPAAGNFTMAEALLSNTLSINKDDLLKDTYYYYVFENDAITAAASPTIVTLIGEDKDGEVLYWPVHLAPYEQWKAGSTVNGITRGNSYDMTITLTGDATGGDDGGGGEDPTNPVVKTSVNVSVSLTPWIPITLSKEF